MFSTKEPMRTRFDVVRTVAQVVTAVCLLAITISMVVAGAYTVTTVTKLQATYHPERLASIISDASDTMATIHKTTNMLKSSKNGGSIMDDVQRLISSVEHLSASMDKLNIPEVLKESSSWRQMTGNFVNGVRRSLEP